MEAELVVSGGPIVTIDLSPDQLVDVPTDMTVIGARWCSSGADVGLKVGAESFSRDRSC